MAGKQGINRGTVQAEEDSMTKMNQLVALNADELIAEHGSIPSAIARLLDEIAGYSRGSVAEYPIAQRKFYRRVLAHLQTRHANLHITGQE